YRVYNTKSKKVEESVHVKFDDMTTLDPNVLVGTKHAGLEDKVSDLEHETNRDHGAQNDKKVDDDQLMDEMQGLELNDDDIEPNDEEKHPAADINVQESGNLEIHNTSISRASSATTDPSTHEEGDSDISNNDSRGTAEQSSSRISNWYNIKDK